ncbi:hypothetical protein TRFO_35168 [Tritrichomonas foetus]|uniref:Uncharacterized protein n=1 Tax=Tritrichomonas foetus TaxID=1144522 RepID=A0A1J4JME5_9EUKA|nr:hypothetical protein TRFO_35168 [Tritrichomonas foetus]|eukprot:OHS98428.1 hypothetical protein TRFO_35168 [Tritrichomonas foetus]
MSSSRLNKETGRIRSYSAFGRSTFDRDIDVHSTKEVDKLIKHIHTMEYHKIRPTHAIPGVIERLLNVEENRTRSRIKSSSHHKIKKKNKEIREVKKVVNPLDNGPGAAHYSPNFDSILSKSPKHRFQKAEFEPIKKVSNLECCTMSEMLNQWSTQIRRYNFQQPTDTSSSRKLSHTQKVKSQVSKTENENENEGDEDNEMAKTQPVKSERKTVRPPPDAPLPPKPESKVPGLISSEANRSSFLRHEETPGPSDYQKIVFSSIPLNVPSFENQAPRPTSTPQDAHMIRDIGNNIDAIKKRTAQCIPFDKQSSREPKKKRDEDIWLQIEAEQARIIENLKKDGNVIRIKKKKEKPPFKLQTGKPEHPFEHIMRKENEPAEPLHVEKSLKALDRPVSSFDISTPAESSDRMVYRQSDAPDVIYSDVNEQYKNTIPRPASPVPIARTVTRHPPYYYMPKPCGQGLYNPAVTSLSNKRTVNFDLMGERQFMLDSPGSMRKKTASGIPPPLEGSDL